MPELPEVETVTAQLAPRLSGRRVRSFRIFDPLLRAGGLPRVATRSIQDVRRSGKRVLVGFSPPPGGAGELWLAVHLRMTGRLLWIEDDSRIERAHLRARFFLDRGSLLFYDIRRFGTMHWYGSSEESGPDGLEPLSRELTVERLAGLIGDSEQNVKAWLLRQDRLVGLGNIYASEILHVAGISPLRAAGTLSRGEVRELLAAMRRILRRAIRACGTTFSDFQDARGDTGSYQRYLKVYGREGEACARCGERVRRVVQQQRSTFFCSGCQR